MLQRLSPYPCSMLLEILLQWFCVSRRLHLKYGSPLKGGGLAGRFGFVAMLSQWRRSQLQRQGAGLHENLVQGQGSLRQKGAGAGQPREPSLAFRQPRGSLQSCAPRQSCRRDQLFGDIRMSCWWARLALGCAQNSSALKNSGDVRSLSSTASKMKVF